MKSAEYLFCPLRWKIALYIRDNEYQDNEQHHNLNYIINKELDATTDTALCIQAANVQNSSNDSI